MRAQLYLCLLASIIFPTSGTLFKQNETCIPSSGTYVVLTNEQIEDLNDCEVLDGNLFIHGGLELTDINLLPLSNLRIINGYLVISKRGSINLRRIVNS